LIAGGGAPEIHVSRLLTQYGQTLKGKEAYCFQAFAEALEVIPTTLAENAGLNPIAIVTELRNRHALGERNAGINVRKVSGRKAASIPQRADFNDRAGIGVQHPRGECIATVIGVDKRYRVGDRNCGIDTAH
jgi:T-complex protein 1 subunit delta